MRNWIIAFDYLFLRMEDSMNKRTKDYIIFCYKTMPSYFLFGYLNAILAGIMTPILIKVYSKYIDLAIDSFSKKMIVPALIYSFLFLFILTAYDQFNQLLTYNLKNKFSLKFRQKLLEQILDKINKIEYKNMEDPKILALLHRIKRSIDSIDITISYTMEILSRLVSIIGIMFVLASAGIINIVILVAILLVTVFLCYICSNNQYRYIFDYSETDRVVDYIEMLLRNKEIVPETKIFNSLDFLKLRYIKNMDKSTDIWNDQIRKTKPIENFLVPLIGDIFLIATYLIFLMPLMKGQITIGFYFAIINASISIISFIVSDMPGKVKDLFILQKYLNNFTELIDIPEIEIEDKKHELSVINSIKFDNVYYKYPNSDNYVLKGISFDLVNGNHYALIGENGAGKTTIIKLLTGLYKATSGEITINGVNINEYSSAELSKALSVAFQNFAKFNITLKDFITLSSEKALNTERANDLVKKLQLDDVFEHLEDKYNTILGKEWNGGVDISGGQWQKLALLRLLYNNTPIQILDEPTAALDPVSESKIYQLYETNIKKDHITVFISHRLASTKFADKILLIKDGVVKENGTHSQLIELKGDYYKMFQSQKQWYLRDEIDYI